MKMISVTELKELLSQGQIELFDVRTPVEYQEKHIAEAKLLPLDKITADDLQNLRNNGTEICLICKSGTRSGKAAEKLSLAGFKNISVVDGGTDAWVKNGFPVVQGKKAISLERQVRIAAGSLVFIGTIGGVLVNPWILILSGFVGAGLVFAGITNTCGMGLMLAKMPWNQKC